MEHSKRAALAVLALSLSLVPAAARAHCDTLDGPVVMTARHSLETKDVRPVLAWVMPEHEPELRAAFTTALSARTSAPRLERGVRQRFFETVVRVHRAGEGAPYTGSAAGAGVGEGVRAADWAIESGDLSPVEKHLVDGLRAGLNERFATLRPLSLRRRTCRRGASGSRRTWTTFTTSSASTACSPRGRVTGRRSADHQAGLAMRARRPAPRTHTD